MFLEIARCRSNIKYGILCAVKRKSRDISVVGSPEPRKITVAVKMMNTTGRQRLRGVYRYVAEGHDWDVHLIRTEDELNEDAIRQAARDGTDGFLVLYHPAPATLDALKDIGIPVATFSAPPRSCHMICLPDEDNHRIGAIAAEHFLSLGRFRSFGFVPD